MNIYFDKSQINPFELIVQLKAIAKLSIVIFLLSIIFCYGYDISKNEWLVGAAWIKKDLYISFVDIGYKYITFPCKYGFNITLTKEEVMQDGYVLSVIDKFKITSYKSLFLAAINIAAMSGFIISYFKMVNYICDKSKAEVKLLRQKLLTQEAKLKEIEAKAEAKKSSANFTQIARKSGSYKEFSGSV